MVIFQYKTGGLVIWPSPFHQGKSRVALGAAVLAVQALELPRRSAAWADAAADRRLPPRGEVSPVPSIAFPGGLRCSAMSVVCRCARRGSEERENRASHLAQRYSRSKRSSFPVGPQRGQT